MTDPRWQPPVHIRPDPGRAWTALVFAGVRFGLVLTVLMTTFALSDEGSVLSAVAATIAFLTVLTLAVGGPAALWWWLRPGQVSYLVTEGELRVLRGATVVRRHPCTDITSLELTGRLDWRALLLRNWFDFGFSTWPRLEVDRSNWPTPRMLNGPRPQPAILIWGGERCGDAEQALRRAVIAEGGLRSDGA